MHNAYPNEYTRAYNQFVQTKTGGKGAIFSRAGTSGAQGNSIFWAGDQASTFTAFQEAVRAGIGIGILHDYAVRSFPELEVVLPEVSYLRTYWLVTHADVRNLRRVEEVYSFILSRVRANRGLFV